MVIRFNNIKLFKVVTSIEHFYHYYGPFGAKFMSKTIHNLLGPSYESNITKTIAS